MVYYGYMSLLAKNVLVLLCQRVFSFLLAFDASFVQNFFSIY